jgi:hypothetical protein
LFLGLFGLNILAVGAGATYMRPSEVSTWWDNEDVREGLGLIITTVALLLAAFTLWRMQTSAGSALRHLMQAGILRQLEAGALAGLAGSVAL